MSAAMGSDAKSQVMGEDNHNTTNKVNEQAISTGIQEYNDLMKLPHGTIIDFVGVVANVGPRDISLDRPTSMRDVALLDIR
uniref:Uncharacterized protein n=1 Tax=Oryza meridionalis TaxID=40149 RepID=A0A0E0E470_9ORYZ